MGRFKNPEFIDLCINFHKYMRAYRRYAPKQPPNLLTILMGGASDDESIEDFPINPLFSSFWHCLSSLRDDELVALYAIYIGRIYVSGVRLRIKDLYPKYASSKMQFYRKADLAAVRVFSMAIKKRSIDQDIRWRKK